jgi:UPF0042 nucleotide-binding protein
VDDQYAPHIIFVGGLSGSGRTTAMGALEDLGFYSVDNIPPQLVEPFVALCEKSRPPIEKIALALDARDQAFLKDFPAVVASIRERGAEVELLFLDCRHEVLQNRYRETRRVHPLSPAGPVEEGIHRERALLLEIASLADTTVDTSDLNVNQLRDTLVRHVSGDERPCVVHLLSFGYRYGIPNSADLLFDVRFLRNPHYVPELRAGTGLDPEVSRYVLEHERSREWMRRFEDFIAYLLHLYDGEGKAYLHIGIGCTGGRHRSVAVAEALGEQLREMDAEREVSVAHRDAAKGL